MEWRTIPSFPQCEVSNIGVVRYISMEGRHSKTSKVRPIKVAGFGYEQVCIDGKTASIHNLVAEAFIGPHPGNGYEVDHIDENRQNNRPNNLQYLPHGCNTIKSKFAGNRRYFYDGELWLIKKLITARVAYWKIGKMFKCSTMLIQDIKKGLKDNHIKENL